MSRTPPPAWPIAVVATLVLLAGCGPAIETRPAVDAPPLPETREVVITETTPSCERQKVGDIRVQASDWPEARAEVEDAVRQMGGEAVIGWREREVVVDEGGAGGSGVPGASTERARRDAFYFGVVVRFAEECPVT